MKRRLTLFEMSTISKASKVFGKCVNEMIAHTSIFNDEVPQHSLSYKTGGVSFNDIITYTRANETTICKCDETGVVTCNITLPKYTKRKLKWFIANIVSNDSICSGRTLRAAHIKWAYKKMWDGLGIYRSRNNGKKYIEFEVHKFRVTTNKDGSYKLQAYIYILSN